MFEIFPPSVQSRPPFSKVIDQAYSDLLFSLASETGSLPYGLSPILNNEVDEEVNDQYIDRDVLRHCVMISNGGRTGLIQPASSVPAISETLKFFPNVNWNNLLILKG